MAPTTSVFIPVSTALQQMIQSIQASGAALTDFTTGSGLRTLLEAVGVVASNQSAVADQLQLDAYLDTATGSALDALGANNWQVPRKSAVQASGQVTIMRQSTAGAMVLPAGFTQLATVPSVPGGSGVGVLTTQDASFAAGQAAVTVTAQAVLGGSAGNLSSGVYLQPLATVNGVSSQNGFQVTTAFSNGVDAESDDAYRTRIPIAVQGRASKGQQMSFLAAALGVPGVLSAGVIKAGGVRGDGSSVPAGSVEVYYQGSSGLLAAVQSAAIGASTINQNINAYASVGLTTPRGAQRVVAIVTVYVHPGTDPVATGAAVSAALQGYVNGVGLGNTARVSLAVNAVLAVTGVVSVGLPLTQFSLYGGSGAADIAAAADSYPSLAAIDTTVVVNTLPA
jgi:uncharacterized phage protein gp47/JayE